MIRTGRGHDFKVRTRDWVTGKVKKTEYVEVKSSPFASLSELQKEKETKELQGVETLDMKIEEKSLYLTVNRSF